MKRSITALIAGTLLAASFAAFAGPGAIEGVEKQPVNVSAIAMFLVFVVATLGITKWAAGKTNETTRDIVQAKLFGEVAWSGGRKTVTGTGLIPGDLIGDITWKQGVSDLIDTAKVKHISGGWSAVGLKSYQQGRGSFEGTEQHGIWLDEEAPMEIYGECLIRTATTNGLVMMTFTPLDGMTETVMQFLPDSLMAELQRERA